MLKICYVIGQLKRGGAEKQLYELINGLDRKSFEPCVISLSEGGSWSEEIRNLGIPVFELPNRKKREISRLVRLVKLFRKIKPDIVHTYLFSANTYGRIAAKIAGTPIIIASERNEAAAGKDKKTMELFIDRILAVFSDAIICNSFRASSSLLKDYCFSSDKVFAIHNGINGSDGFAIRSFARSSSMVIGTVGRLHAQKNHKLFLEAARLVLECRPDKSIRFLVVGKGPLKNDLIKCARELGIESNVVFTGERMDIAELLQDMDIFIMTSDFEGLSNAIMEAMLSGLPVVATNVGGNSELIVEGKTGFLCPPGDPQALSQRIIGLLADGEQMIQMGKCGRERIIKEFSIDKMVRRTEEIYFRLLSRKGFLGQQVTARNQ